MKLSSTLWMSALLSALLLTACGEKAEEPAVTTEAPAAEASPAPEAAPAAPAEAAPAPAAKAEPGGYEPAERVPGITMTQEEIDKIVQEGLANTPLPTIPGG